MEQRAHIVERGKPAARDDRNGDRAGERSGRLEIEPGKHAVACDVGIDDGRHAGVLEAARKVERGHLARLRPAFDRNLAVARIDADGDAAGKVARGFLDQRRVAHRSGAEDHAVDALVEPGNDGVEVADAAAELHRNMDRGKDRLDSGGIHRTPFEGAVEIDHMQPLEALLLEASRLRRGVLIEHGRLVHLALAQPDALSVFQVDGGKQDHGFHRRKFAISASPSFWLFSGWNWRARHVVLGDEGGDRAAIVGAGDESPRSSGTT